MQSVNLLLPEITVTDWILKLGEAAFSAWLRLRLWRERNELNVSIRQLIKKLGASNHTFYTKILPPLYDHGLIEPYQADKRCMYLTVFDTPLGLSEKATLPLERCRSYSNASLCCVTDCNVSNLETFPVQNVPKNETVSLFETNPVPKSETFQIQEHSISYLYNQDLLLKDKEKEKEIKDKNDPIDRSCPSSLSSLPSELQTSIERNPKLHNQIPSITELYQQFQAYPLFSLPLFIDKMTLCMEKVKNVSAYKTYFQKTLLNLWNQPQISVSSPPPSPPPKPKPASDIPVWIVHQEERDQSGEKEELELAPLEKRLQCERLLKELDVLCGIR